MSHRLRGNFLGLLTVLALTTLVGAPFGCSSGGGGGGGGGGVLALLNFNLENINGVFLNERLVFEFSTEVDPASVSVDTIQIRFDGSTVDRDGDGSPDNPGNTNATPPGDFVVKGKKVFFNPRLPVKPTNSDTGFIPTTSYQVVLPASPNLSVRSRSGRPLTTRFAGTFKTRDDPAFPPGISLESFKDFFPGVPRVATLVTPTPIAGNPLKAENADPSTLIEIRFTEPILPSSIQDGLFLAATGPITGREINLATIISVVQEPETTLVRFEPTIDLPGGIDVEVVASLSLRDFGGNRLIPSMTPILVSTAAGTPVESNRFLASGNVVSAADLSFETNVLEDLNETGALWNAAATPGQVVASGGGSGSDGPLVLLGDFMLDTDGMKADGTPRMGLFEFTRLVIPSGFTLTAVGSFPLRLLVSGNVTIQGVIDLTGQGGENAVLGGLGGVGVANGGSGGDGGQLGLGDPGLDGAGPGAGTGSQGAGAGEDGGGGGGAGYAVAGNNGSTAGNAPGVGGPSYGDSTLKPDPNPDLNLLLGGSGGGGSGFIPDNPGAGGGAGGGAIQIQAGRVLSVNGGVIDCSGGDGGNGFTNFGATGGGGSGGGILLQSARTIITLASNNPPTPAMLLADRGAGGTAIGVQTRRGGRGSDGRIHIQTSDFRNGFDTQIDPTQTRSDFALNGQSSVGVSVFLDSRQIFPDYVFNPATDADPAPGSGVTYVFQGAPEDPMNPGRPDLTKTVPAAGFTDNIDDVDELRFIRFAVQFVVPEGGATITAPDDPGLPRANSLSLKYVSQ